MKDKSLYEFIGDKGQFRALDADQDTFLYFPLANEKGLLSAITPRLHGDVKLDQHSFLIPPVTVEDLHDSRSARGFWISSPKGPWSLNGSSPYQRGLTGQTESVDMEAGLLWHRMKRTNTEVGWEATVLNFVPAEEGTFEVMMVEIKNIASQKQTVVATSAIPIYARSADNLRDHRHVSSLLNRVFKAVHGLYVVPTMSFNERGHNRNQTTYSVLGVDAQGRPPVGFFPTVPSFIGEKGDLERPAALFEEASAKTTVGPDDQGKEAFGGLRFEPVELDPGQSTHFILCLGIDSNPDPLSERMKTVGSRSKVESLLKETEAFWTRKNELIQFKTGNKHFNQWVRWVCIQPLLRKIFGCSFLPDFDYGRGGRGWRDLWQDCLALLLANPTEVRPLIVKNFSGVRLDGSNATIIGREEGTGEPAFIADRNNITRTWMDHGIWPFMTTELYLNQTGDWSILLEKVPYFRDAQLRRGKKTDLAWLHNDALAHPNGHNPNVLKTQKGEVYQGTVLEHILVQNLVQFFNVGEHNIIRLEDADWNDGLDMAPDRGESVAFTSLYAGNFNAIADVLEMAKDKDGLKEVLLIEELLLLLDRVGAKVNYDSATAKTHRLQEFFDALEAGVKGRQASIPVSTLVQDLRNKAAWIKKHLNEQEWLEVDGLRWFNGYYDNNAQRLEGKNKKGRVRMTLTGQVYPIMSGVADPERVRQVVGAVNEHLWDHELQGFRLNTDFEEEQPDLGRAFSFAYGEKENGAVFSHMVVMYANALYRRGFVEEGHRSLDSLYRLAENSKRSRIFPGIPEYFNNEGRGRYHYLTGSASWYVLTLITQVFGVCGKGGDLLVAPKLVPDQYDADGQASVELSFAGSRLNVTFHNPSKVEYDKMKIDSIVGAGAELPMTRVSDREVLIHRELIRQRPFWDLVVNLSEKG